VRREQGREVDIRPRFGHEVSNLERVQAAILEAHPEGRLDPDGREHLPAEPGGRIRAQAQGRNHDLYAQDAEEQEGCGPP